MQTLTHEHVTTLLLALAILLLAARALGELARKLHQPAVIGELIAGILLGPTVLGSIWPSASAAVFPATGPVPVVMQGLTTLAITLFLLVAGMEVDLSTIWRRRFAATTVGLGGMILPVAISLPFAFAFPHLLGIEPGQPRAVFAFFFATAMAISALPVIAKILIDLQLFRTDLGMTVIAAAVFNDLFGWIAFAFILTTVGQAASHGLTPLASAGLILLFLLFMLTAGRSLIHRVLPWIQAHLSWPGGVLGFALVLGIACASLTEWIGVHAIFGAFIAGVALGDSRHLRAHTRETIDQFISIIFAPLFFATIGLRVDFFAHFDPALVALVLVIASVGKVLGCSLSARIAGFKPRDSWAIGFGMNARGAMEIILGLLALEAGLIGERLFVALVIMALVTSISSGTLIQRVLGRKKPVNFWAYASARSFMLESEPRSGAELIGQLARTLADAGAGADAGAITAAAIARERILGSGIGGGVAVPHARIDNLQHPLVAVAVSKQGIDFDARDGSLAHLIILIVTPSNNTDTQLQLLASIARTCHNPANVERLVAAGSWTEFLAALNSLPPSP